MRRKIPINFTWYVKPFEDKDLNQLDLKHCQVVDIPNQPIKLYNNYFKIDDIQQKFTYYYPLKTNGLRNHENIYLQFDGVAVESDIYVNQKKAGHHISGYTPFSIDIKPYLNFEKDIQDIMVIVSGIERENVPPFGGVVDYLGYVGIYREVYLDLKDQAYIKDVFMYSSDPLINYERLKNKAIYMSVGLKDRIVPMDYAKELSLKLKTTYQEYDVEHTSTENMLNEVVKFIQNNLL